jgi:hypothetical protein
LVDVTMHWSPLHRSSLPNKGILRIVGDQFRRKGQGFQKEGSDNEFSHWKPHPNNPSSRAAE